MTQTPVHPYLDLIEKRHSGRAFDLNKKVKKEHLLELASAAHLAPSCYNDQPWHFLICDKEQHGDTYAKVLGSLVEFNQNWAKNAPVLVVVLANKVFTKNQKPNRWGPYDSGAAALSWMLKAEELGLMTHQMGGFDEHKIQKELNIPDSIEPMAVMAVGYEANGVEKKEPKDRRPVAEQFYFGSFGKGLQ